MLTKMMLLIINRWMTQIRSSRIKIKSEVPES